MSIRTATAPNMSGLPVTPLFQNDLFEQTIFAKGYSIIKSSAVECPCKGKSGASKTTCHNCLGLGWIFIDNVETKAIVTSANKTTKYQAWSPELVGTINITVREVERFALMDKIVFKNRTSLFSEVKPIIDTGSQKFIFCSYDVRVIRAIYIFGTDLTSLIKLTSSQYSIKTDNPMVVFLSGVTYPTGFNGVVSIYYENDLSFNIVDINHDFRSTSVLGEDGRSKEVYLPVSAVARRSHLVLGISTNYAGDNLLSND